MGVAHPATEVKNPCYKCINENAVKINKDNAKEIEQKMRERTGAGNDSFMMSLTIGDNWDEDGYFICNKPEGFVNIDMLGKKPWKQVAELERVGKMYDSFGNVVDRPDITLKEKTLQYDSAYCIAQRNASLAPHEIGSLNPAYVGMSARAPALPAHLALDPKSPVSTVGSSSIKSPTSAFSIATSDGDTPLTDCFSDVPEIKDVAAVGPVGGSAAN